MTVTEEGQELNIGTRASKTTKGEETRQKLRNAAVDTIYELGYDTASIDKIVARASLTKGSFYHHFSSKEDLLAEIHNDFMDVHLEELREVATQHGGPPSKIRAAIYCLVAGAKKYQKEEAIFFEEHRRLTGASLISVKNKRDEFRNIVADFIREGAADGSLQPVDDATVMSFGIVGMASWTYLWIADDGLTVQQIADMYADTVLSGLVAGDAI